MGEQSNAYRILLRYDRKSRHRRIKKQRRYERLAATSQFRETNPACLRGSAVSQRCARRWTAAPSRMGVARTLSSMDACAAALQHPTEPTPLRALYRPAMLLEHGSRVGCGLSLPLGLEPVHLINELHGGRITFPSWYQRSSKSSPHPGVLPSVDCLSDTQSSKPIAGTKQLRFGLGPVRGQSLGHDYRCRSPPPLAQHPHQHT